MATPTAKKPSLALFGSCEIGQATNDNSWHDRCAGLIAQPRGGGRVEIIWCSCPHHQTSRVYRCSACGTMRPLADEANPPAGIGYFNLETGTCANTEECETLVRAKSQQSALAAMLREVRMTAATDITDTTQAPSARRPRAAKNTRCHHCADGTTKGGTFAVGHDAKLKSQLAKTYADADAPADERLETLFEAIQRGWLKNDSAHDVPQLLKGVSDEDTPRVIAEWDRLVIQAGELAGADDAEQRLAAIVARRIGLV